MHPIVVRWQCGTTIRENYRERPKIVNPQMPTFTKIFSRVLIGENGVVPKGLLSPNKQAIAGGMSRIF